MAEQSRLLVDGEDWRLTHGALEIVASANDQAVTVGAGPLRCVVPTGSVVAQLAVADGSDGSDENSGGWLVQAPRSLTDGVMLSVAIDDPDRGPASHLLTAGQSLSFHAQSGVTVFAAAEAAHMSGSVVFAARGSENLRDGSQQGAAWQSVDGRRYDLQTINWQDSDAYLLTLRGDEILTFDYRLLDQPQWIGLYLEVYSQERTCEGKAARLCH